MPEAAILALQVNTNRGRVMQIGGNKVFEGWVDNSSLSTGLNRSADDLTLNVPSMFH